MPIPKKKSQLNLKIEMAQDSVDRAYALHDSLYAASEAERYKAMGAARDAALALVADCEAAEEQQSRAGANKDRFVQARLYYLRGKALACAADGRASDEAERLLADAVKLEPSLVDAWNCLGECFWQRGELETARHTFLGALAHERNAATLCHLSMLLRAMSSTGGPVNSAYLLESVNLAKESVRLDPASPRGWEGLGAAHTQLYLRLDAACEDLHLANRAYTQAARTSAAGSANADLRFNHGNILTMLDSPAAALEHFAAAHKLDPSLGAASKREEVWLAITKVSEGVAASSSHPRGSQKQKRLAAMVAELPPPTAPACLTSSLALGDNGGKVITVKVIVGVPQHEHGNGCHQCLIVADQQAHVMALSVYQLSVGPLEPGTTLEVKDPQLVRIEAARDWEAPLDGGEYPVAGYHLLRVEVPSAQMRIDGQPLRPIRRRSSSGG